MKINVILSGSGGELDRRVIETNDDQDPEITAAARDLIHTAGHLCVGDTISVEEAA